jgi:hypothetical protein
MDDPADNLVQIDADGNAHPLGYAAVQRMQVREGRFHVFPAPAHIVVMRHAPGKGAPDDRACLLAGEIKSGGSLCDVASFVGHSGWRGELVVMDDHASRSVYFEHGAVVGANSTAERERLGQVLFRYGVLDAEQTRACATAVEKGEMRFGEAAVRFGYVSREAIFAQMSRQIEEIFYGLLLVSSGMFYFLDGFDDEALAVRQTLSVGTLIREGVRRMHEMRYFRSRIPSDRCVVAPTPGRAPPDNDTTQVFAALDGSRTISEVCRVLGQGEFEVTRAVFQLVQSGHVFVRPPRLTPEEALSAYNKAIAMILRELDAMDEGDEIRQQLADFAARGGVYAKLFKDAGPTDDGTIDATKVAANIATFEDAKEAESMLGRWLYEYASYALFLARPLVRRAEDARRSQPRQRLSQRVAEVLEPIASPGAQKKAPSLQRGT